MRAKQFVCFINSRIQGGDYASKTYLSFPSGLGCCAFKCGGSVGGDLLFAVASCADPERVQLKSENIFS